MSCCLRFWSRYREPGHISLNEMPQVTLDSNKMEMEVEVRAQERMAEGSDIFKKITGYMTETQTLLETESAKLKDEQEKLARDFPVLHKFTSDPIKLNIGGQIFITSLSTLTRDPKSMLASMFSGRFDLKPGEDGCYFIDRDPTHFRYILNYLRTGNVILPQNKEARRELRLEAGFFNVHAIERPLTSYSILLPESTIILFVNQEVLGSWLQNDGIEIENWKLIYRGTKDSFQASSFHRRCDNRGATIIAIKTTQDYIFGGYSDVGWTSSSSGQYVPSTSGFLFAFVSHGLGSQSFQAFPTKRNSHAFYHESSQHVTFGDGHDLHIADQSNSNSTSYSDWGHTYDLPPGKDASWLNGQRDFQTVEIEVFARQ